MFFHDKPYEFALKSLSSNKNFGLDQKAQAENLQKYGRNLLEKRKKRGFFTRIFDCLKEPMLIILAFGFIITVGTNLGKYFKSGSADFSECLGILFAIVLSVTITMIMEGSSNRAFETLNRIYDNVAVRVIRGGKTITISQTDVIVGDILLLESGDKIIADGRLIESVELTVDESSLTGESEAQKKNAGAVLNTSEPLRLLLRSHATSLTRV